MYSMSPLLLSSIHFLGIEVFMTLLYKYCFLFALITSYSASFHHNQAVSADLREAETRQAAAQTSYLVESIHKSETNHLEQFESPVSNEKRNTRSKTSRRRRRNRKIRPQTARLLPGSFQRVCQSGKPKSMSNR